LAQSDGHGVPGLKPRNRAAPAQRNWNSHDKPPWFVVLIRLSLIWILLAFYILGFEPIG
jgi:hypothetical protein